MEISEEKEIIEEEKIFTDEEIKEPKVAKKGYSIRFYINLVLSIAAIALLIFLNSQLRAIINLHHGSNDPNTLYDNYFFDGIYTPWGDDAWTLDSMALNTGFYIVMPIILVLLFVSGSTILAKDNREARIVIFINWFLYLANSITTFAFYFRKTGENTLELNGNWNLWYFALFPFFFMLFMQVSLLVEKRTFLHWLTFWQVEEPDYEDTFIIILRAVNIPIMLLMIGFYSWGAFHLKYPEYFSETRFRAHVNYTILLYFIIWMILWSLVKLIAHVIKRRKVIPEQ